MTGRRLYDKYCDAVGRHRRNGYRHNEYVRVFPEKTPVAWPFLSNDERRVWNTLAEALVTRRGAKRAV